MKYQLSLSVTSVVKLRSGAVQLCLEPSDGSLLPAMAPGQFVEVAVPGAGVLLNRPFSIHDCTSRALYLLIKPLGRGSRALADIAEGTELRVIGPLGRGFAQADAGARVLLVGGGVGIAPLYYQARSLAARGIRPVVVYGERTAPDEALVEMFSRYADVHVCTDDGSAGFHGLVTAHPAVAEAEYDLVQVCGPMPMMRAMYGKVADSDVRAQFSLENKMACGLGACLCCVEDTQKGHRCVCTDGPVFDKEELKW